MFFQMQSLSDKEKSCKGDEISPENGSIDFMNSNKINVLSFLHDMSAQRLGITCFFAPLPVMAHT